MRGHLALISAEKFEENGNGDLGSEREDFKKEMKVPLSSELDPDDIGEASYGLRENPKKCWKISNSKHGDLKKLNLCKECGKGFPSLRALSGHMRSHSMKGREEIATCKECGKEFDSMRALFGHMRSHSKRLRVSSESADYEISCPIRKKRSRIRYNKITSNPFNLNVASSITVIEIGEVGFDPDDLGLQTMNFVDQDFGVNNDLVQNATVDSEFFKDFRRKRRLKCKTTHTTVDSCIALKVESSGYTEADSELEKLKYHKNSLEQELGGVEVTSYDLKRSKEHECSICFKVFASGQALGGPKGAHYNIGPTERRGKEIILMDQELPDRVDDNLSLYYCSTLFFQTCILQYFIFK